MQSLRFAQSAAAESPVSIPRMIKHNNEGFWTFSTETDRAAGDIHASQTLRVTVNSH